MQLDIGKLSRELGWAVGGVAEARLPESTIEYFERWLKEFKGPQMSYLERRKIDRVSPKKYLASAKTVLCFGHYYFPGWAEGEVKVSNYSWGEDYHQVLKAKLDATASELKKIFGDFEFKVCVDTAPVLEKAFAVRAGIGWQGKNTLLLHPKFGSFLFLGEIISSLPFEYFVPELPITDHCGTCDRCIQACPTGALKPYVLDATKCISYWTLEHRGDFTDQAPAYSDWVAGCDICQEVCPWNQKLIPIETQRPQQQMSLNNLRASDLRSSDWLDNIKDLAISYVPSQSWTRNLNHIESKEGNFNCDSLVASQKLQS